LKVKLIHQGFSLIEVLVSLCILTIGLSSLLKMQIYLMDDYQESRLLVDATHLLSDVQLSEIYQNHAPQDLSEKVEKNFPQGDIHQEKLGGYQAYDLVWKLPRRLPYHVQF
jgi:prepilin-type N-terminal cleavage/methylation domain-containing protein